MRAAREANAAMPAYAVGLLGRPATATLVRARAWWCSAPRTAAASKETAFSGVFPMVDALRAARRRRRWCTDPMYYDRGARGARPAALPARRPPSTRAVVQTDHAEYRELAAADLPGVRALVDGRRVTDPDRWPGVERRVLGVG